MTNAGQILCAAWLALVCLGQFAAQGSELFEKGREIYRSQCASCHGPHGEGVLDKYDEALVGDWPIERLIRIIERTMPEEDPNAVTGLDAEAVARYVHDAFYSREARARNRPPRIELVRLTNRQYLNSVADLVKHFTGIDKPAGDERGLQGVYFNTRRFNQNSRAFERVDRQVHFDFGESSPDAEKIGVEEFAMRWTGAVLADETGDYEIALKTTNGARLWLNDDNEPLIDAWVASGDVDEHRATIRLIGGRAYPVRLDYFKHKETTASISLLWKPPHGVVEPVPARNLSPSRVTPTLVITTPFPPDDSSVGYERGVAVSKQWADAATHAAVEVANHVVKHLDRLSRSKPEDADRAAKVEAFCVELVEMAFRRPLTEAQKQVFVSAHLENADTLEDGVKRVALLALKSPRFLYLGLDGGKPDDFDVAARLSFALWDSIPDRALWDLAQEGSLRSLEQVRRQARSMLADARARAKMQDFFHYWLQMHHIEDFAKDAGLFPGFSKKVVADLRTSLDLFLEDVLWHGSSDFRELLLADYLYLNDRLAKFYEAEVETSGDFVKVALDPAHRSGVLTHPYLLSGFSYPRSTSPIHRGVFATRSIVGRALRPPPVAVSFDETEFDPKLTMREKITQLTRSETCQSCHSVIDPLGFSLEYFDAVGRYRTHENDRLIDAATDFLTEDGETIRFQGARDVSEFAVGSEQAQKSFVEHLFNQLVKQPILAYGPDTLERLRESFVASDFNIQKLMVDIGTTSALYKSETLELSELAGN